ncbi:MAG: rhodanese-like domain-containing protein [Thiolinea sp.]
MHVSQPAALLLAMSLTITLGACSRAESLDNTKAPTANVVAQQGIITNVSNAELQDLLDKGVTLVDIRRAEEWQETGVVAGSQRLTLFQGNGAVNANFLSDLKKIVPADKPVALICRTGNRTRAGSEMLTQVGYTQVYNVTQGITGWIKEGRPVVR